MTDERALLREAARRILDADPALRAQLDTLRALTADAALRPALEGVRARVGGMESARPDAELGLETIVNRVGRPVLEVAKDDYVVAGPEATVWKERLDKADVRAALRRVIPAVGRIEVDRHPDLTWVGTGWLVADDVVVTNRHVAAEFAAAGAAGAFTFKRGWPDRRTRMAARVDFRRELRDHTPARSSSSTCSTSRTTTAPTSPSSASPAPAPKAASPPPSAPRRRRPTGSTSPPSATRRPTAASPSRS